MEEDNSNFISIPKTIPQDLTIIYKGKKGEKQEEIKEIKTSKDELVKKLRYFKQKASEINHMNEIFIHDDFDFDTFKSFIDSTVSSQIRIDHSNYSDFYKLSRKYGYAELEEEIKKFISNRPDLKQMTDQLSIENQKSDTLKEEVISKNLDHCLKSGFLDRIPLKILIRILNSPNRVVNDHHLLFDFVLKKMKTYKNAQLDDDDKDIVQILPSCLDFCKMSNTEVVEIVKNSNFSSIFIPQNSQQIISTFSTEMHEMKNVISKQQEQIQMLLLNFSEFARIKENNENKFQQLEAEINKQKEIIQTQQTEIQDFQRKNQEYEKKIDEQKKIIQSIKIDIDNIRKGQKKEMKNIKLFNHNANSEFDGIINYLTKNAGGNLHDKGVIEITSNYCEGSNCHPKNLLDFNNPNYFSTGCSKKDAWICFDFKKLQVSISKYTIKSSEKHGPYQGHLKNWIAEISSDGENWTQIGKQSNCSELNKNGAVKTFDADQQEFARYFRICSVDDIWRTGNYFLKLNSIELYGQLIE